MTFNTKEQTNQVMMIERVGSNQEYDCFL